jgi:hypothetical protein
VACRTDRPITTVSSTSQSIFVDARGSTMSSWAPTSAGANFAKTVG